MRTISSSLLSSFISTRSQNHVRVSRNHLLARVWLRVEVEGEAENIVKKEDVYENLKAEGHAVIERIINDLIDSNLSTARYVPFDQFYGIWRWNEKTLERELTGKQTVLDVLILDVPGTWDEVDLACHPHQMISDSNIHEFGLEVTAWDLFKEFEHWDAVAGFMKVGQEAFERTHLDAGGSSTAGDTTSDTNTSVFSS